MEHDEVAVIAVPLPAQGHLNQMLQLACLVSSYGLPVFFVGSALHNRQAKVRINGLSLSSQHLEFHDIATPPFASPPPDPNSEDKFPTQLRPMWDATWTMRQSVAAYLHDMAGKFRRVVVVHDAMMTSVVQDVASLPNSESYAFNTSSAFSQVCFIWAILGSSPFPVEHPKELPLFDGLMPAEVQRSITSQLEHLSYRAGDIFNTCRLIEAPYMEVLEGEELSGSRKSWAIGPMLPSVSSSSSSSSSTQHKCLEWLDRQDPKSVIYVSFGTTVSLSDEQINELAHGLERSKVRFLWVLRDADKGDVFEGEVRRAEVPEGFEERVGGEGMVVRDWAPQPQILGHPSTGGFMSHCGWNSCLESITMGVPIAAWPMHSDQPMNTSLVTDILKISVVVREWKQRSEVVKASAIENVVKRLMASSEGDEMRKRAEELSATVRRAVQPGGASRLEFDSFIAHITR